MSHIVHWNGEDLRPELADLPHGQYVLVPVDAVSSFTEEELEGIDEGLDAIERGDVLTVEESRKRLLAKLAS